jgi:predicted nucleic-acid-binding protein
MAESKQLAITFTVCSLDTNTLIRWLLWDNEAQAQAVQDILDQPKLRKVHVSDIAIAEMVWVLQSTYQMSRNQVGEALETLFAHPKFILNKTLFNSLLETYRNTPQVSFVDLMLAGYGLLNNASPVLTFDPTLAKNIEGIQLLKA